MPEETNKELAKLDDVKKEARKKIQEAKKLLDEVQKMEQKLNTEKAQESSPMKVGITVGIRENGIPIFQIHGNGTILEIEGAIRYAQRRVDELWRQVDTIIAQGVKPDDTGGKTSEVHKDN